MRKMIPVALLLTVLAGCVAKKQIMESSEECTAARDAALRAASACERCCSTSPLRK